MQSDLLAAPPEPQVLARPRQDASWPSLALGSYAVAVLFLAYTFAYLDRAILTVLVEPIQRDLHINDTELALLYGFAFVIFYVALGLPLGMLADRSNRKRLIVACIAIWSFMTAACGLAGSYSQLFLARVGVGIGEAGLSPASYSLLADYFPPHRRTTALGLYSVALFFGAGLAILCGGIVNHLVGREPEITIPVLGVMRSWQAVFVVIGLPGIVIALLAASVKEPLRQGGVTPAVGQSKANRQVLVHLKTFKRCYLLHFVGFGFLGVPFNVALLWARPYLSRRFHVDPDHAAYFVGSVMLVFATSGIVSGSWLADRLQKRGRLDATILLARGSAALVIIPIALFPFMPDVATTLVCLAALLFLAAASFGAAPSALQLMTPNHMRAVVSALYLLAANLIGLTMGPAVTGFLTDYVFKNPAAVGFSASLVGGASALIALLCFTFLSKAFPLAVAFSQAPSCTTDIAA